MINDPRYRHNRDGRDEQVAAVRVILDRMAANPKRVVAALPIARCVRLPRELVAHYPSSYRD